jgi:hypothetical protein
LFRLALEPEDSQSVSGSGTYFGTLKKRSSD